MRLLVLVMSSKNEDYIEGKIVDLDLMLIHMGVIPNKNDVPIYMAGNINFSDAMMLFKIRRANLYWAREASVAEIEARIEAIIRVAENRRGGFRKRVCRDVHMPIDEVMPRCICEDLINSLKDYKA